MKSKMQFLKQSLIILILMISALSLFSMIPATNAAILDDNADRIGAIDEGTGGESDIKKLVIKIVDYFLGFLGLLAVIMVVYGGVTYVSSAGNDEAVGKAKKIIMYALIGLVIILLAFVLVRAVLGAGTGSSTV